MKKSKQNYYIESIEILMDLKRQYPSYSLGKHLATALDDYKDVWGISDKEILFALTKYMATMTMDVPHETEEKELQQIIDDGLNLKGIASLKDDYELNDY
jgi:hypothetical protein